jgi:tRNA(Ile)-lysidine synthase TilS/MesJ
MLNQTTDHLLHKLDYFFTDYILPELDPSRIVWLFSLSGGIDSWACKELVSTWYKSKGMSIREKSFHINQWEAPVALTFKKEKVEVLNAQSATRNRLNYITGQQAPCHTCSGVRHDYTDRMIQTALTEVAPSDIVIAVRGHHLTDLAISLLWRYLIGRNPSADMLSASKGHPFQHLEERAYLAKPLIYILKSELEAFAEENKVNGECACVACPAHNHPSRRDVVNETAGKVLAIQTSLWEFSVHGLKILLNMWSKNTKTADEIQECSLIKSQSQHAHMPMDALDSVEEFYCNHLNKAALPQILSKLSKQFTLDDFALPILLGHTTQPVALDSIPIPKFLQQFMDNKEFKLSLEERLMLLCLGPFWGAFALPQQLEQDVSEVRAKIFPDLSFDEQWSHVGTFLRWHYSRLNRH